jgi:predicted NAD-dependent protein-ADP-ribosyltransferase YbiA (DUF1768 family)
MYWAFLEEMYAKDGCDCKKSGQVRSGSSPLRAAELSCARSKTTSPRRLWRMMRGRVVASRLFHRGH